jgi:hypothetical protein
VGGALVKRSIWVLRYTGLPRGKLGWCSVA